MALTLIWICLGNFILAFPISSVTSFINAATAAASVIVVACLFVYAYACVSSYIYALLMMLVRAVVPIAGRPLVHWLMAAVYLFALGHVLHLLPVVLTGYAATAIHQNQPFGYMLLAAPAAALFNLTLVFAGYVVAATLAPAIRPNSIPPPALVTTPGELAARVFLIMMNSAVNMLLGTLVLDITLFPVLGERAHVIAVLGGLFVAVLNLLAIIVPALPASVRPYIHGLLGWLNWLMPSSWLVIAIGWILFVLNLVGHLLFVVPVFPGPFLFPFSAFFAVLRTEIDWPTGTIFTEGGVVANLWVTSLGPIASRGAYDMGNLSFVHALTTSTGFPAVALDSGSAMWPSLLNHEAGHSLSLAAFGSFFHAVGACDENLTVPPRLENAYSERLAESHDPDNPNNWPIVPMWN